MLLDQLTHILQACSWHKCQLVQIHLHHLILHLLLSPIWEGVWELRGAGKTRGRGGQGMDNKCMYIILLQAQNNHSS